MFLKSLFLFFEKQAPIVKTSVFTCGLILFLGMHTMSSYAQNISLSGKIIDAQTKEPIPFAAIAIVQHNEGTLTDTNGYFLLKTKIPKGTLRISAMGYETQTISFKQEESFTISLKQSRSKLKEVKVKASRRRYRNKGNPAVDLIKEMIRHKDSNRLSSYQHVQYQEYEKTVLSSVNTSRLIKNNILLKKYQFFFDNVDTVSLKGKKLVPAFLEENLYDKYYQKSPKKENSILTANKRVNLDRRYVNNESLGKLLGFLYQSVDIYDNKIFLLTNEFMSPLSPLGPQFFRYFITDTLTDEQGDKKVRISFEPRNSHDMAFYGTLLVALNGRYSVTETNLYIPVLANLNWINSFSIHIKYEPDESGKYYLKESNTKIEAGLGQNLQAVFGERTILISDFDTKKSIPDSIFAISKPLIAPDSIYRSNEYWDTARPKKLSKTEQTVYSNIDSLNNMKSFKRLTSWFSFLAAGYKNLGPVELGPWDNVYSYNAVRGPIARVSGRTTSDFNKHIFIEGNLGYGFKDQKLSYLGSVVYTFNQQNPYWGYPHNYIGVSAISDTRIPGRGFSLNDERNILLSLKRGENDRYFYNKVLMVNYVNELIPKLRFDFQVQRWQQEAAGSLLFVTENKGGGIDTFKSLTTAGVELNIRWAPKQDFTVGRRPGRNYIPGRLPVFEASFKNGIKGFLDGEHTYQQVKLRIQKRVYLSRLGMADVNLIGGYLFGTVPYPLLFVPPANQSYEYQAISFNQMNYMEFISDRYTSLTVDYHMKGLLLNYIPGIRWLKFREVFGFRAIYGDLRPENAATLNSSLFKDEQGRPTVYNYQSVPYMEFSVGVENILNVFRVVYTRRLNYLHHPGVSLDGIHVGVQVYF